MKRQCILALLLGMSLLARAQDTVQQKDLDEILIYSTKFAERKKNITQKIDIISAQRIAQLNAQSTGDLLQQNGNLFVQKSQQGGSSPVIRGFEASRVLLVIDGVRMNNAIYRAGHLQNVITVDPNMLERVEILYGPASTLYGSDALGGVIHLRTKSPRLSTDGKTAVTGSAFTRYSSANSEATFHADLSIGGRKLAWLQSYNYSNFGDLRMGSHDYSEFPGFGHRPQYIAFIGGKDSIVQNSDDRVQRFSGYRQWDITQKLLYRPNGNFTHALNLQLSNSGNVPRYDRLTDVRNGNLRYAEWYYGPQLRTLASYELNWLRPAFLDALRFVASFQHIHESRNQREYRRYDRLDSRVEDLSVGAFNLDGRKVWQAHELTVGIDGQLNWLQSAGTRKNILTGAAAPLDSRYPNGKNRMHQFGIYAQHLYKFGGGKWVLNDGVRIQAVQLRSTIADNSFFNFPFTSISQDNWAVTGNLGLVYLPSRDLRVTANLSTGFRAPNIDDGARIFESNTASRQLILPNPDIRPEYTYNADLGLTQTIGNRVRFELTGFYTWFHNAIALAPFQLNGEDSVDYNGANSQVFANQNVNRARIYGFSTSLSVDLTTRLQLASMVTYTHGRLNPGKTSEVPLDHIPPVFGRTALTYTTSRFTGELYALYNGWKRRAEYNPSGEDNAQYATPSGTPGWTTINLKTALSLGPVLQLQLGVENVFDRNYRFFASGISAPGRNFIAALRATW